MARFSLGFITLFFSLISFSAENIDGFLVEPFPNDDFTSVSDIPRGEIRYGQRFLESDEWQKSPLSQIDAFAKSLIGQSLFLDKDSQLLAVMVVFAVDRPITDFNKTLLLDPTFHQKATNALKLTVINQTPLAFHALADTSVVTLEATLKVGYLDNLEIPPSLTPYLHGQFRQLPKAISVRYSNDFNRVLHSLVTISQFYEIDAHKTFVMASAFINIKDSIYTTGYFTKGIFRSKVSALVKKVVFENVKQIYDTESGLRE